MTTSTQWRINISANNGYIYGIALAEIVLRTGPGVAMGTGTASASTSYNFTTFAPNKAVDGNNSTCWATTTYTVTGWWAFTFSSACAITTYDITCYSLSSAPMDWTLEYYNGSSWVVVDTQTGVSGWTLPGDTFTFNVLPPIINDRDLMLRAESPRYIVPAVVPADLTTATGTISAAQIAANAVTAAAIAANAVTTAAIAANAVTTALLESGAVTSAKIGNLAVTTATIDNLSVTTGKIANLAVDSLQIAGNAVTVNQIVTGSTTLTGATSTSGGSTGTPQTILTATVTVAYAGYYQAAFACRQGSNSGPQPWTMDLKFDGTSVFATGGGTLGGTGYAFTDSVAMIGAAFLTAGAHTVDVVWVGDTTMQITSRAMSIATAMK